LAFNFAFAAVAAAGVQVALGLTNSKIKPGFIEKNRVLFIETKNPIF
jgi:hypothetical protein